MRPPPQQVDAPTCFRARVRCVALLAAALLIPHGGAEAAVHRVWACNDGEKIEQDDLANANVSRNSAWDGRKIKIFGARNETIAFQVIVEADGGGIAKLSAALPELRRRGGGGRIVYAPPAADPTDYVGRPIQIFSENYMNVTTPTPAAWVLRPG